jgi:hypothetical protein
MRRSFSFRSRTRCHQSDQIIDVLCIYFGQSPVDITLINDEIQNTLKIREPIPDAVYVLSHGEGGAALAKEFDSNKNRTDLLLARGKTEHLTYLKDFAVLNFQDGIFKRTFSQNTNQYDVEIGSLLQDGIARLVEDTGAYQSAPTGHVFKHPSGRKSKHFLLATELLSNEVDAYFLALCICVAAESDLRDAETLYIDTMGIYAIARAVQDILQRAGFNGSKYLRISSFHSHEGIRNFQPNTSGTDIALISASTSGGLASLLCDEKGFTEKKVITLLDISSNGRRGHVIYDHSKYLNPLGETPMSATDANGNGEDASIELVGEYFAARGKRPKSLTLAREHAPENLKALLDQFAGKNYCSIQEKRKSSSGTIDVVTLSQDKIVECKKLRDWLIQELRLRTPASVSHILSAPGNAAESLANFCADQLNKLSGKKPSVVLSQDIARLQTENASGVLICTALVGNGHALRLIARDLREYVPTASRHFIIGCGLPDTYSSWNRLRQFLTQSGDSNRPYLFACWKHIAIGVKNPNDSWSMYSTLMQKLEHVPIPKSTDQLWGSTLVSSSMNAAMRVLEENSDGFLPNTDGAALALTEGFVYWQTSTEQLEAADQKAASYLAISSVVQNAREYENSAKRLRSTLHETVVLDPENFLRFNDGILHACLLRSTKSFELDYSMSPDFSQSMREILEKIFSNHSKKYGEAAIEFAAALASGHLRLSNEDLRQLAIYVVPKISGTENSLLGLLYAACEQRRIS